MSNRYDLFLTKIVLNTIQLLLLLLVICIFRYITLDNNNNEQSGWVRNSVLLAGITFSSVSAVVGEAPVSVLQ